MPPALELRPLSARSIVLSLLLGAHPPAMSVRDLLRAADLFEISESALRVALTRMVAGGDLSRVDGEYRLADRLLERQRRQDQALSPAVREWRGDWEIAVVVASGRSANERADQRTELGRLRLAELREGVWMRPDNLDRDWPSSLDGSALRMTGRPGDDIASRLWDLPAWVRTGQGLLRLLDNAGTPSAQITAAAGVVRHLTTDPVLPADLLPNSWPADEMRAVYADYQAELTAVTHRVRSA